jgi:Flp pilus assembly protein TadG
MRFQDIHKDGFLNALAKNQAGNVMVIVAAGLLPLLGLIGGGVDMSRIYLAKTRLQQACDAGALSGRKQMAGGAWSAYSNKANTSALNMFNANFLSGAYGTNALTKSFSEANGKVSGTASVVVPMTIMQIFGQASKTITVTCEAEMRIPNTDVMFVLDTTGSMAQTNLGDSSSKIDGLKRAVKCFYESLAKVDTTADCGLMPVTGANNSVQIRFGFVPYSSNVNVGRLLRNEWMVDTWAYQSRLAKFSSGGTVFKRWEYDQQSFDVSGLKAGGTLWNASIQAPVGANGAQTTIDWDGCIEERQTYRNSDDVPAGEFTPIPSAAYDLDIDMTPTSNDATKWKPLLPGLVWGRYDSAGTWTTAKVKTTSDLSRNYSYACPAPASKLRAYSSAAPFESYVNGLYPNGNTYHDIGLLWGARLMSPTGLFSAENAFTPAGGIIERHMVFMTDGDTVTSNQGLIPYGVSWWDRRQTRANAAPSDAVLTSIVNERTQALCSAIKAKNITLWVVSFGSGVSSSAQSLLQSCASPNHYYTAGDSDELIASFQQIADAISQLRLTS